MKMVTSEVDLSDWTESKAPAPTTEAVRLRVVKEPSPRPQDDTSTSAPTQPHPAARKDIVTRFVDRALLRAVTKRYPDGTWFAEIPRVAGVWASEATEEGTLAELESVLRAWAGVKLSGGDRDFPVIDRINLNVL